MQGSVAEEAKAADTWPKACLRLQPHCGTDHGACEQALETMLNDRTSNQLGSIAQVVRKP